MRIVSALLLGFAIIALLELQSCDAKRMYYGKKHTEEVPEQPPEQAEPEHARYRRHSMLEHLNFVNTEEKPDEPMRAEEVPEQLRMPRFAQMPAPPSMPDDMPQPPGGK